MMRIGARIVSVFVPLFIAPMVFLAFSGVYLARAGITNVATTLLEFKSDELTRYATSQYQLLMDNQLADRPQYVAASKESIASFASGLLRSDTELILAVDSLGTIAFTTSPVELKIKEISDLTSLAGSEGTGWHEISIGRSRRVAGVAWFEPFEWSFFVTDLSSSFFAPVEQLTIQSVITAGASLALVMLLIGVFSRLITNPLKKVVGAMRSVVSTGDLSGRVDVPYDDETGELADSFNSMTQALESAYSDIKTYALKAAISQKREMKVRNVFQKYVPNQVIEQFFASPESMLVGEDRKLSILFSDVRGFTTLSERMSSRDIVESLNQYFGRMVGVVMKNEGVVDKYIGDAVMAVFGAPAEDEDSAYHSVLASFEMLDQLAEFNVWQQEHDRAPFEIGVGISFGSVTIGNIGSDQKMDYTVIGDMVNVASRLEGLTKIYHEPVLITESVRRRLSGRVPCRMVDRVQVKGRSRAMAIYSIRRELTEAQDRAWQLHHRGLQYYYNRDFAQAQRYFAAVSKLLPDDPITSLFLDRATVFASTPPPEEWTGMVVFHEK